MESYTKTNNQLLETDTDILMSILPSNVWAHTSKILEKKHPSSLENLSNSSLYFRNLVISKRVHFLFPQVFKTIGSEFSKKKNTKTEGSNIIKCRMVSKSWSKGVDQFVIEGAFKPDFFNTEHPQPSDHALVNARYQYFGNMEPEKLPQFLTHFRETHPPNLSRNPFIGKVVYIDLIGFTDQTQWASIADQVSTLLRKYGHHIEILNLCLFKYNAEPNIQLQSHSWLCEWLENCPNLTHLKVSERYNFNDDFDVAFGIRPDHERTIRLQINQPRPLEEDVVRQVERYRNYMLEFVRQLQCDYSTEDGLRQNQYLVLNLRQQNDDMNLRLVRHVVDQRPGQNLEPNLNLSDVNLDARQQYWLALVRRIKRLCNERPGHFVDIVLPIVNNPISIATFKKLQCLKLCQLSALNFNSIICANTQVTWLHIEPLRIEMFMYIDYLNLEFPNLRKLHLKLCSPEEVGKLKDINQSWLSLTHLHFEYCVSGLCSFEHEFMEWAEIFKVISQNWGETLTDLKLRLPIPKTEEERRNVERDSELCRFFLPNLKRLKFLLRNESGERLSNVDFLDLMRPRLEELIIA